MENSQLTVNFLNVQPIFPQNNLPFDQTNREFYLLLIFKKLLNFVLYFIKDLFVLMFYEVYLYTVFKHFTEVQVFLFPIS